MTSAASATGSYQVKVPTSNPLVDQLSLIPCRLTDMRKRRLRVAACLALVSPIRVVTVGVSCGLLKELLDLPARTIRHEADIPLGCSSSNSASRGSNEVDGLDLQDCVFHGLAAE